MGLFGRFFRKSGDREREGAHRCMECGMTGGEHTDWCPVASEKDVDSTPRTVPEPGMEDEGRAEPHP
jgi:hypothetical protein